MPDRYGLFQDLVKSFTTWKGPSAAPARASHAKELLILTRYPCLRFAVVDPASSYPRHGV